MPPTPPLSPFGCHKNGVRCKNITAFIYKALNPSSLPSSPDYALLYPFLSTALTPPLPKPSHLEMSPKSTMRWFTPLFQRGVSGGHGQRVLVFTWTKTHADSYVSASTPASFAADLHAGLTCSFPRSLGSKVGKSLLFASEHSASWT